MRLWSYGWCVSGLLLLCGCVTEETSDTTFAFAGDDSAEASTSLESRIKVLERRIEALPERIDLRAQLAQLYFDDEKYEKAIETIEEAIQKDPENARLYQILGDFYVYMNRFADAEVNYRKVVQYSKPGFTGPHLALGYVLAMQEKYPEAVEEFKKVLLLQPNMPTALYYLGSCYDVMGQRDKAMEYFQKCAEIRSPYQKKAKQELARLRLLSTREGKPPTSSSKDG